MNKIVNSLGNGYNQWGHEYHLAISAQERKNKQTRQFTGLDLFMWEKEWFNEKTGLWKKKKKQKTETKENKKRRINKLIKWK